jgi:hypothetical protein
MGHVKADPGQRGCASDMAHRAGAQIVELVVHDFPIALRAATRKAQDPRGAPVCADRARSRGDPARAIADGAL